MHDQPESEGESHEEDNVGDGDHEDVFHDEISRDRIDMVLNLSS